ncbi:30S ribosomal protein S24e [Dictyocoela roeselum]|nr:30S ribosomal protein S24e [Dictyocoela roeselum]
MSNTTGQLEIQILNIKENKLMERKEIELKATHLQSSTPTKEEMRAKLSPLLKANPQNIIVCDCKTRFGTNITTAKAKVYDSLDQLKKIEHFHVVTKITGEKKTKANRRARKDARKKKVAMWGTLKRNMKKAEKRNN